MQWLQEVVSTVRGRALISEDRSYKQPLVSGEGHHRGPPTGSASTDYERLSTRNRHFDSLDEAESGSIDETYWSFDRKRALGEKMFKDFAQSRFQPEHQMDRHELVTALLNSKQGYDASTIDDVIHRCTFRQGGLIGMEEFVAEYLDYLSELKNKWESANTGFEQVETLERDSSTNLAKYQSERLNEAGIAEDSKLSVEVVELQGVSLDSIPQTLPASFIASESVACANREPLIWLYLHCAEQHVTSEARVPVAHFAVDEVFTFGIPSPGQLLTIHLVCGDPDTPGLATTLGECCVDLNDLRDQNKADIKCTLGDNCYVLLSVQWIWSKRALFESSLGQNRQRLREKQETLNGLETKLFCALNPVDENADSGTTRAVSSFLDSTLQTFGVPDSHRLLTIGLIVFLTLSLLIFLVRLNFVNVLLGLHGTYYSLGSKKWAEDTFIRATRLFLLSYVVDAFWIWWYFSTDSTGRLSISLARSGTIVTVVVKSIVFILLWKCHSDYMRRVARLRQRDHLRGCPKHFDAEPEA